MGAFIFNHLEWLFYKIQKIPGESFPFLEYAIWYSMIYYNALQLLELFYKTINQTCLNHNYSVIKRNHLQKQGGGAYSSIWNGAAKGRSKS